MATLGRSPGAAPLTSVDIPDNSITAAKIVEGTITVGDIGTGAVGTDEIATGAVDTAELADDAVTGAKIENNPTIAGNLTVSGDIVPSTSLSNRNMIINGGFQIWQRGESQSNAQGGWVGTTADRWKFYETTDGSYNSSLSTMSPADQGTTGHRTALWLRCSGVDSSIAAAQNSYIWQPIEAQNLQHLRYGTANAKTLTLSFWVKSNKTGIYTIFLQKAAGDATEYTYRKEYTISSADTWEQKTITITPTAGSTSLITSAPAAIDDDNGTGISLGFGLAWGSDFHGADDIWTAAADYATSNQVNWMDSTSNNFYITGVQLELGSNATPFEHRTYGEELIRCQRYYFQHHSGGSLTIAYLNPIHGAHSGSSEYRRYFYYWPQVMRAAPTVTATGSHGIGVNTTQPMYAHFDSDQSGDEGTYVNLFSVKAEAEL